MTDCLNQTDRAVESIGPTTISPGDDGSGRDINPIMIIYYDDACGLCRAFRGKVEKSAASGRFEFRKLNTPGKDLRGYFPAGAAESLVAIDRQAVVYKGHEAVAEIAMGLNSNYRLFGRLLMIWPVSILARLIYRLVSANRYRLSALFKMGAK